MWFDLHSTHGYNKPFAVTYLSTASFVAYLVPFAFLYWYRGKPSAEDAPPQWYEKLGFRLPPMYPPPAVSYTHLRAHET